MKKIVTFLTPIFFCLISFGQTDEYYRVVDWKFYPENVIQLTDSTYQIDAIPFDYNDPGAISRIVGNYVVDYVGHRFEVIDSTATTLTVKDIFITGQGPQSEQIARCYRSVGNGGADYIGSVDYFPLDETSKWKLNGADNEFLWRAIPKIMPDLLDVIDSIPEISGQIPVWNSDSNYFDFNYKLWGNTDGLIQDEAYNSNWNGKDSVTASKDAIYDKINSMEVVDYCPDTTIINTGTISAGSIDNLCTKDGNTLTISEAAGTDPLRVTFTFTDVDRMNYFLFYGQYSGGATHILYAEIYNPSTLAWDYLGVFGLDATMKWHSFPIYLPTTYISGGNVQIRIAHQDSGNPAHYITLDYVDVNFGGGGGGVSETASEIHFQPAGTIAATNVQTAIEELDTDIATKVPKVTSTDNAIARFNGTTGDIQNSGVTIDDSNNATGFGTVGIANATLSTHAVALGQLSAYAPASGSGNYIQNQNASAQSANMWISGTAKANTFQSTVATGTAPLTVASTTLNTNLNADLLDGQHGSYYQPLITNPVTGTGTANYIPKWGVGGTSLTGTSNIYDDGSEVRVLKTLGLNISSNGGANDQETHIYLQRDGTSIIGIDFRDLGHANPGINLGVQGGGLFVKNGGNVGIGTTDPQQKFDVNGNARFRSIGTGTLSSLLGVTSDGTLTTDTRAIPKTLYTNFVNGILIETYITTSDYSVFNSRITLNDFNSNTPSVIDLFGVQFSDGTYYWTKGFFSGKNVQIKVLNYNGKLCLWINTTGFVKIEASVTDNSYSGITFHNNEISSISNSAEPAGSNITIMPLVENYNSGNLLGTPLTSGSAGALGTLLIGQGTTTAPSWGSVNAAIGGNALTSGCLPYWDGSKLVNSFHVQIGTAVRSIAAINQFWYDINANSGAAWSIRPSSTGNTLSFYNDFSGLTAIELLGDENVKITKLSGTGTRLTTASSTGQLGAIANAAGYLYNDGSGNYSYNPIADSYISNLSLSGNTLTSTGVGSAFNSTVGNIANTAYANIFTDNQTIATSSPTLTIKDNLAGSGQAGLFIKNSADLSKANFNYSSTADKLFIAANTGAIGIYSNGVEALNISTAGQIKLPQYTSTTFDGTATKYLGVDIDGNVIKTTISTGTTTNALTMNNSGTGAASGTTFDGSVARTISYNTIGAASLAASNTFTGASQTIAAVGANLKINSTSGNPIFRMELNGTFVGGLYPQSDGRFDLYSGSTSYVNFASPLKVYTGTSAPTAVEGGVYYNTTNDALYTSNGTTWTTSGGDGNTTYSHSAETVTGGANLRLTGSDASTDDVKFASGGITTVSYTDPNTITINTTAPADGKITNVTFATPNLTFTGSNGAFNGSVNISGLSVAGGWTDGGTYVYPTTSADEVRIGGGADAGSYILQVTGESYFSSHITCMGQGIFAGDVYTIGSIGVGEIATPTGETEKLYSKTDNKLYYYDNTVEFDLTNVNEPFRSISANTTLSATDKIVLVTTGGITITYPTVTEGKVYIIRNTASSAITVPSYTVLGPSSSTSVAAYGCITVVYNGTNWYQLD